MASRIDKVLISKDRLKFLQKRIKDLEFNITVKSIELGNAKAEIAAKDEYILALLLKIKREVRHG